MMTIHLFCPDVYAEFVKGNFSFQKTGRIFSKMSVDQVHEQNNEVIKGIAGATPFLNRENEAALERWELSGTEIGRLVGEFEVNVSGESCKSINGQMHKGLFEIAIYNLYKQRK